MEAIITTAVIIVVAHLALGLLLWLRVRKLYSYPGLLGFPVFGNLYYFYKTLFLLWMHSMEEYMINITEKYGKDGLCFHWFYGFKPLVIVSCPKVVKELAFNPNVSDKSDILYKGIYAYAKGPFTQIRSDDLWKQKRKEYNIGLKRSHIDNVFCNIFNKSADKLIDLMLASASSVDALHATMGIVRNVTLETLFNVDSSLAYDPQLITLMKKHRYLASFIVANPNLSGIILNILRPLDEILFRKLGEFRKVISEEIDKTLLSEQCPLPEQYLTMQIVSRTIKCNGNNNWNTTKLQDELMELYFTATLTVSSVLSNTIIILALLPDIQERVWQEQYRIFGNDNRDPSIDDLKEMQFLDRCIKESLRFLGPPFVAKSVSHDIDINGIIIPRGTNVLYLTGYLRMDPKHWKNPKVFDPDRFLEESETLKHSYSPFGIGVRGCPGSYFAPTLMKITLSKVLRRLKLRPVQKDFRFEDIKFKVSLMTEIEDPPALQVEERT